jgi:hypothetical protein
MKNDLSTLLPMAPSTGAKKEGHPEPLSYFVAESKSA